VASLSVSPFTAVSIRGATSVRTNRQELAEREIEPMLTPHRSPTNAEAWERFETDYSPPQQSPSSIKRRIESAKLGLDTALFAVDHFVKNVESQADFTYDQGSLRRTPAVALEELRKNPRVKLDLEMWQGSKPYVGVRLIIPVGN
jgi:hypothetical protein